MGLGQMMATISFQPQLFEFWNSIFLLAIVCYPPTILVFTLVFLGKQNLLKSFLFWLIILTPSLTGSYLVLRGGNTLVVNDFKYVKNYPWGNQVGSEGRVAFLIIIWYQICFLTSLALLIRYIRKTQDKKVKKQTWFLIIAIVIPFIGGVLTQGVLPQFHIRIFPVGIPLNTINALIIAYALIKYGSSVIDPSAIASSVTKIMHNGLIVTDSKSIIVLTNPFIEQFLGYQENELVGKEVRVIFSDTQSYLDFESKITSVLKTQEAVGPEEMIVASSAGEKMPINLYASNYQDKFNGQEARILVLADIQKLKSLQEQLKEEKENIEQKVEERTYQLKEERAKLEASIKGLSLGFIMVDRQLNLLTLNEAAKHILFHKRHTFGLDQNTTKDYLSENLDINLKVIFNRLGTSLDLESELKRCITDKKPVNFKEISFEDKFLKIMISPIILEQFLEAVGSVVVIEDITEEKNIQRSKDEFFSLASHELRTPLTAVKGYMDILKRYFISRPDDNRGKKEAEGFIETIAERSDIGKIIDTIESATNHLIDIVNDFIDTFALEQKKIMFRKDKLDLDSVVKEVIGEYQQMAKDNNLYLRYESVADLVVLADKSKVKQVMANLISNSLKFTQMGGITVKAAKMGNFVEVRVGDSGKGISLKLQNLLFKKFQQAVEDIYTRDGFQQGTGLGLYISRLLVEGMGGKISLITSEVGKGSVFGFTLPLVSSALRTKHLSTETSGSIV